MSDRAPKTANTEITELRVSGHMMALEPGLYCVFNAPDGPSPSADTGLPGVRVTAGPGRREGQVSVSSFHSDGWIGADSAALVRVVGSAAEVLVTVYQSKEATGEAPKLQVVRLSGGGATGEAGAQPAAQAVRQGTETVEVVAHVYARGDVGGRLGDWMGEPGSNRWIEGFGVAPAEGIPASDVEYQAVLGRGWLSPWSEGGQFCGSRGMSLPILGLRVRLRGASAGTHRSVLSATFVDGTKVGPVYDGEACEALSLAALEAFQVQIERQGGRREKAGGIGAGRTAAKEAVTKAARTGAVGAGGRSKAAAVRPPKIEVAIPKAAPGKGGKKAEAAKPATAGKASAKPARTVAPAAGRAPARKR